MGGRFSHYKRDDCRFCGSRNVQSYIDLGAQPPSNSFIRPEDIPAEESFPLEVYLCTDCGCSQLLDVVAGSDIFDEYAYLSSTSRALCNHYQGLVDGLIAEFEPADGALVMDIGCNDGIMLDRYPAGRFKPLGVEPSNVADYARKKGHKVHNDFFGEELAKKIVAEDGRASLITMTNVFAHIDDIHDIVRGLAALLAEDGVFALEFPYVVDTVDDTLFDTIYHEHLGYLALTPVKTLLATVGLRPFAVERIAFGASGPALRVYIGHESARPEGPSVKDLLAFEQDWGLLDPKTYERFAADVREATTQLADMVRDLNAKGEKVAAFSAPAKGNTLLNTAKLTADDLVFVTENNDIKIGLIAPGSHIPVVSDQTLLDSDIKTAVLLSWNYADFFVNNSDFVKAGGRFIVPLPRPHIRP